MGQEDDDYAGVRNARCLKEWWMMNDELERTVLTTAHKACAIIKVHSARDNE